MALTGATASVAMASAAHADVLLWSTQSKPVEETEATRGQVLAGKGAIAVPGALDGDFSALDPADLGDGKLIEWAGKVKTEAGEKSLAFPLSSMARRTVSFRAICIRPTPLALSDVKT